MPAIYGLEKHIRLQRTRPRVYGKRTLTADQRRKLSEARAAKKTAVSQHIAKFHSDAVNLANDMSQEFGKKPRYYLNLMFHGGSRLVKKRKKINAANAFKSLKLKEMQEDSDGRTVHLMDVQGEIMKEYENLSPEEKERFVEEFRELKEERQTSTYASVKSMGKDFYHTCNAIEDLIGALRTRVGVDGFFCITRSNPHFNAAPHWYFSRPEVEAYIKTIVRGWKTDEVGTKLEAFTVANCDILNMLRTSKDKANYMKARIRDRMTNLLTEITDNPRAIMQYTNYERDIVQRYGIELQGWTAARFVNPSELSDSLGPLRELLDALESGKCKFVKVSENQLVARMEEQRKKVASGDVPAPRERKKRSDAGTKRKKQAQGNSTQSHAANTSSQASDPSSSNPAASSPALNPSSSNPATSSPASNPSSSSNPGPARSSSAWNPSPSSDPNTSQVVSNPSSSPNPDTSPAVSNPSSSSNSDTSTAVSNTPGDGVGNTGGQAVAASNTGLGGDGDEDMGRSTRKGRPRTAKNTNTTAPPKPKPKRKRGGKENQEPNNAQGGVTEDERPRKRPRRITSAPTVEDNT